MTPPRPDLEPGAVDSLLAGARERSGFRTARYQDSVKLRAEVSPEVSRLTPFSESGPNALGDTQSSFESAVLGSTPDTSTAGLLRAIGGAMLAGMTSPIASITDEYQVGKIRDLQKAFLDANNDSLLKMNESLAKAKRAMRDLSEMMAQSPFDPSALTKLLRQKQRAGNDALQDIDARLQLATDPDERRRLEGMRDDLTHWMKERDERTSAEQGQVGALTGRLQGLEQQMMLQRGRLEEAALSDGPRNVTNGGRVIETSHDRPDAAMHAAGLQDMLLGSKAGIDSML
jgi:hypothetical protein